MSTSSETFRVIVAGSRSFDDYNLLCRKLDKILSRRRNIVIVSGTARGADTLGERYALERGYVVARFPAEWERFGRSAGAVRNETMARYASACIVFWDGTSRGSQDMARKATRHGLPLRLIRY